MLEKFSRRLKDATTATKNNRTTHRGLRITNIIHVFYRFVQIIMACVVIGFYAQDLTAARKVHKYSDSKWVYAVVVGSLSAVTALVMIVFGIISGYRAVSILFPWEWILVILWSACSGLFGVMYRTENPEMDEGIAKMKTAWKFDCVNLAFWGVSAITATIIYFRGGRGTGESKRTKSTKA